VQDARGYRRFLHDDANPADVMVNDGRFAAQCGQEDPALDPIVGVTPRAMISTPRAWRAWLFESHLWSKERRSWPGLNSLSSS
jgi:hypothetical protein